MNFCYVCNRVVFCCGGVLICPLLHTQVPAKAKRVGDALAVDERFKASKTGEEHAVAHESLVNAAAVKAICKTVHT